MNLHLFTMKMVDDCHSSEEQKLFTSGLTKIDQMAEDKYSVPFVLYSGHGLRVRVAGETHD